MCFLDFVASFPCNVWESILQGGVYFKHLCHDPLDAHDFDGYSTGFEKK